MTKIDRRGTAASSRVPRPRLACLETPRAALFYVGFVDFLTPPRSGDYNIVRDVASRELRRG